MLLALAALYLVNVGWGLPSTDGWDDDGVAPRDFLYGLVRSYTPGEYYTYPPGHLLLLTAVTAPVWLPVLVHAPSRTPAALVAAFVTPGTMTALAVLARLVQCAMALGLVWAMAQLAGEIAGRRAALLAGALCGLLGVLGYYAHATNLDVPVLFWAGLALLQLTRAVVRDEPRRLRAVAVLAALAVASKDQAAALFLLSVPAVLLVWRSPGRWREGAIALALGGLVYGVLGAPLVNPHGFLRRLPALFTAGRDYAAGDPGVLGALGVLAAAFEHTPDFWPWPVLAVAVAGVALGPGPRASGPRRLAALVPVLAALSFTLCFTLAARRTEHRFVLPQFVLLSVPAGLALDRVLDRPGWRRWTVPGVGALLVLAAWGALRVAAAPLRDPRLGVERFLAAHLAPGERIETYGSNVYLPRFPAGARVTRVDDRIAVSDRNPLPGVEEVQAAFDEAPARGPTWIVAPRAYTRLWISPEGGLASPLDRRRAADIPTRSYFLALREGTVPGYVRVATFACSPGLLDAPRIHASTCEPVDVLRRRSPAGSALD
jgi:Dolichyl-phosphate-mannose-protein mannosyltransferase